MINPKKLRRVKRFIKLHWRMILLTKFAVLGLGFILLFHLTSLPGGMASSELTQLEARNYWRDILNNPLYAPLTILTWFMVQFFPDHAAFDVRAPSVFFGIVSVIAFGYILRRWYGIRTALYGTTLFACSAWLLHVSRLGDPSVLYLWSIPALLATIIAWERQEYAPRATIAAVAVLALLLYVPGMIWLLIAAISLQPHHFIEAWRKLTNWHWQVGIGLTTLVLLLPLIIGLARTPSLAQTWIGLPMTFSNPGEIPRNLGHSLTYFIWRGPADPALWLDRQPILSVFGTVMALLGAIFYAKHWQAPRTRLLLVLFIIGAIFAALGGPVSISILVPLVYFVVIAGIGFLLHDWLRVFPRNPLARGIGFTLLGIAVAFNVAYEFRSYFIAWPHNPSTIQTFHNK